MTAGDRELEAMILAHDEKVALELVVRLVEDGLTLDDALSLVEFPSWPEELG